MEYFRLLQGLESRVAITTRGGETGFLLFLRHVYAGWLFWSHNLNLFLERWIKFYKVKMKRNKMGWAMDDGTEGSARVCV